MAETLFEEWKSNSSPSSNNLMMTMGTSSSSRNFTQKEGSSDDDSFEQICQPEAAEDMLSQNIYSNSLANDEMNQMDFLANDSSINDLQLYIGMTFESLHDAKDFYYEYAKCMGFTIRANRVRYSSRRSVIISRDFVCSREGFRAAKHSLRQDRVLPPRPVTREGCKAMIRLAVKDQGKWVVTKFVSDHNHKLLTHCKYLGELPIVNILSEEEKDKKIQELNDELHHERERSAAVQCQLQMILKVLEEHADFMSIRVEDIVKSVKGIELDDL